jgi:hypothetical protein
MYQRYTLGMLTIKGSRKTLEWLLELVVSLVMGPKW